MARDLRRSDCLRDNCAAPRVIKRRTSKFASKQPEHLHPPQPKKGTSFREIIRLTRKEASCVT